MNEKGYLFPTIAVFKSTAILLVTMILMLNTISLFLSFPPVFERSAETHNSGIDGSLPLPYLPASEEELRIEVPSVVNEGETFNVRVETTDGGVPDLPFVLMFEFPNGTWIETPLHDAFEANGNWFAWTIVQGMLPRGEYGVNLGFRGPLGSFPALDTEKDLIVLGPEEPYLTVGSIDNTIAGNQTMIRMGGPSTESVERLDVIIKGKLFCNISGNEDGEFVLDLEKIPLFGWNRVNFELVADQNVIRKDMILHFPADNSNIDMGSRLTVDQPFREFDELYEQKPVDVTVTGKDEISLISSTYYRFDLRLDTPNDTGQEQDTFPDIPENLPVMYIEGKRVVLRPDHSKESFIGISRTPKGYVDGGLKGILIDYWPFDARSAFFRMDLLLKERQSPVLRIEPDPYNTEKNIPSRYIVSITEGFELISYRNFKENVSIVADGNSSSDVRVVERNGGREAITYTTEIDANSSVLDIRADTEFRMNVWVSLLFLVLPVPITGIGVPVWFTLISVAIVLSLLFIGIRSMVQQKENERKKMKFMDPFSDGSDISLLSRTFIGALFFSWSIVLLFDMLEQPTPTPEILSDETPIWIRMILLADASVWEEIISRVMLIGIPLMFIRGSGGFNADRFKILLGGQNNFKTVEIVLIILSSSFFGLAHLGWGPWKIIPTFVTGALFGYLYIKVGLHAAIAMHFLFDYNSFIYDLTDIPLFPLYALFFFSLLIGGFFLAEILTGFKKWMESRSGIRIDPKWVLVLHSSLSLLLMAYIFHIDPDRTYIFVLGMVPVLEIAGYALYRSFSTVSDGGDNESDAANVSMSQILGFALISIASISTLVLAPLGLIWVFDRE